jgi:hypothetical protein
MIKKILLILTFLLASNLSAKYVTATGAGTTCNTAVNDALQNAVKQVAGAKIKSSSKVSMGELESDKIFSSTAGLVKNYKQIGKESEAGYCEITIKANVVEGKVEEALDDYIKNKSSMRMFNKTNFKDRSVVVLYSTRGMKDAFQTGTDAVTELMDDIEGQLRNMAFDIKLSGDLPGIAGKELDDNSAIAAAIDVGADAVVLATLTHSGHEKSGENAVIYSKVLIKAYEPSTKRLFANVNKRGRTMIMTNSDFAIRDGMGRGAIKVAKSAVPKLVKDIVNNLSQGSKKVIKVVIHDIPGNVQRKLRKAFKNNEIDFKVAKRSGKEVVLEIDTTDTLTDFEDTIYGIWEEEKVKGCPEVLNSQGSRIELKWTKAKCE